MATTIDKYVLETSVTGMKDVDALNTSVTTLGKSIDTVTAKKISMTINATGFDELNNKIGNINTSLSTLANKTANPKVTLSGVDQLNTMIGNLTNSISQLSGKMITVNADDDQVSRAKKEVDKLGDAIDAVDNKDINVKAEVGGGLLGRNIDELNTSFTNFTSNLLTGALAALGALGVNAVNSAGQLSDLSAASDISTSRLLQLKEAFILAGGDGNTFSTVINKTMDAINEAASGNEKFINVFKELQVPIKDVNGKMRETDDIFNNVIMSLAGMEDKTKRQTLATDLFGRSLKGLDFKNNAFRLVMYDKTLDNHIEKVDKIGEAWDLLKVNLERDSFGPMARNAESAAKALERLSMVLESILNFFGNLAGLASRFSDELQNLSPIVKGYNLLADAIERVNAARSGDTNAPWWAKQFVKVEKMLGMGGSTAGSRLRDVQNQVFKSENFVGPLRPEQTLGFGNNLNVEPPNYKDFQFGTPKSASSDAKAAADKAKADADAIKRSREASAAELRALEAASKMKLEAIQYEGTLLGLTTRTAAENRAAIEIQNNLKRDYLQIDAQILQEKQKGSKADQVIIANLEKQKKIVNLLASDLLDQQTTNNQIKYGIEDRTAALGKQYDAAQAISKLSDSSVKSAAIQTEIDKHGEMIDQYKAQYDAVKLLGEQQGLLSEEYLVAADAFNAYNAIWMLGMNAQKAKIEELRQAEKERSESFAGGWDDAMKKMVDSFTPAQNGAKAFNDLWKNIETSIDSSITTGRFKFAEFRDAVIRDIAAMMFKAAASNLIGRILGTVVSGAVAPAAPVGNAGQGLQMPRAKGGSVGANQPYMVGERGPELFMPGQNGTIIPNRNLTAETKPQVINNYINNVSAVDGQSVARFFMENKNLVAAANRQATKERS